MKKIFLGLICFSLCFLMIACENQTAPRTAHISDITGALSTDFAIKVVLDDDDRVKDKDVGLQIKSNLAEQYLTFGEELGDNYTIYLPKSNFWYDLTALINQSNGTTSKAGYLKYEAYGDRVFRFCSKNDVELSFRMLAGKAKKNEETQEEILALSEQISDEVKMNVKKCQK